VTHHCRASRSCSRGRRVEKLRPPHCRLGPAQPSRCGRALQLRVSRESEVAANETHGSGAGIASTQSKTRVCCCSTRRTSEVASPRPLSRATCDSAKSASQVSRSPATMSTFSAAADPRPNSRLTGVRQTPIAGATSGTRRRSGFSARRNGSKTQPGWCGERRHGSSGGARFTQRTSDVQFPGAMRPGRYVSSENHAAGVLIRGGAVSTMTPTLA
jgi:hypothetical protein